MILRFHRALYSGKAIDSAAGRFGAVSRVTLERSIDGDYFVIAVQSEDPKRARKVGLELANMALGLTIEQGGADR
jgi:hypothetical protein